MKSIASFGFNGMANVRRTQGYFLDETRRITPAIVLNADITDDGVLIRRPGYHKVFDLPGAHSLWHGSKTYCVALNSAGGYSLFEVGDTGVNEVGDIGGGGLRMYYVEVNGVVYCANGLYGYAIRNGAITDWGMPLPPLPNIAPVSGSMPPGVYKFCYTFYDKNNKRLSGNGPILTVEWSGGVGGIRFLNLQDNVLVWATHPNGQEFYMADLGGGDTLSSCDYSQPLPSLGVVPPPPLKHLSFAFGRVWGAWGDRLFYSDEFAPEWFRPEGFLPMPGEILMVAPVSSGIFVGGRRETWFLSGSDPRKMSLVRVGEGVIPGTLSYAMVEAAGYELSRKLSRNLNPAWMSLYGLVVGTNSGNVVHLSEGKLKIIPRSYGAAVYQRGGGIPRLIVSLSGQALGADAEIGGIMERKRLFPPRPTEIDLFGGVMVSDSES